MDINILLICRSLTSKRYLSDRDGCIEVTVIPKPELRRHRPVLILKPIEMGIKYTRCVYKISLFGA